MIVVIDEAKTIDLRFSCIGTPEIYMVVRDLEDPNRYISVHIECESWAEVENVARENADKWAALADAAMERGE